MLYLTHDDYFQHMSETNLYSFYLAELSHGSPHTHRKIDNDIDNVLCQQLARRQDHAYTLYIRTSRSKGVHTCTSWEQDVNSFVAQEDA